MTKTYEQLATEIGRLTDEKNAAYGSSYTTSGQILEILAPYGVKPHQYQDVLACARILDKLSRILTRKDAFGESPYKDIAGYGLLGAMEDERAKAVGKNPCAEIDVGIHEMPRSGRHLALLQQVINAQYAADQARHLEHVKGHLEIPTTYDPSVTTDLYAPYSGPVVMSEPEFAAEEIDATLAEFAGVDEPEQLEFALDYDSMCEEVTNKAGSFMHGRCDLTAKHTGPHYNEGGGLYWGGVDEEE